MQLRFSYQGAYDWYWAIDNIELAATQSEQTAITTVAPFQSYLAPNATVVLRDPVTS